MITTEIVRAPYTGVTVVREWTASTFAVAIDDEGIATAVPISDDQLQDAESIESRFDHSGYLTERLTFSGERETLKETYEYNNDHKLLRRVAEFIDDDLTEIEEHEYDATGREISQHIEFADGTSVDTHHSYDDTNHTRESVTRDSDGVEEREWIQYDANDRMSERKHDSPNAEATIHEYFTYDTSGRLIERGVVADDGSRSVIEKFDYNDAGLEVFWQEFDETGDLAHRRSTEYEGTRVVREVLEDRYSDDVETLHEYDESGNETRAYSTKGELAAEVLKFFDAGNRLIQSANRQMEVVESSALMNHRYDSTMVITNSTTLWYEYA